MSDRILVVDDNEINCLMVENILTHYGLECDMAMSGPDAIELAEKTVYSLIFMDYVMPDMDGIETTRRIKQSESYRSVPIAALSGDRDEKLEEEFLKAGASEMLHKPVNRREVESVLRKYCLFTEKDETVGEAAEAPCNDRTLREYFENIEEFDYEKGLENSMGSENSFFLVLKAGSANMAMCGDTIKDYLADTDGRSKLNGLRIALHSLKSICMNIGVSDVGTVAAMLEKRVKECFDESMSEVLCDLPEDATERLEDYLLKLEHLTEKLKAAIDAYDEMKKRKLRNETRTEARMSDEEFNALVLECAGATKLCDIDDIMNKLGRLLAEAASEEETSLIEETIDAAGTFNYDLIEENLLKMGRGEAR